MRVELTKYLKVFEVSFQQEFVYKVNFIMWRVRNVIQILLVFFLWDTVFSDPTRIIFGYDRAKMMTYIFGLIIVRSIVLSSRSNDVAGEISRGEVTNYLLRPVSYFKYWFTRDMSSKALNLIFAGVEFTVLYVIFRPEFFFQSDPIRLLLFGVSVVGAVALYFLLMFLFSMPTFWYPEQAWGFVYLLLVFTDILGGGVFPLDILPVAIQRIIYFTPFPYLLFAPIQIYLGKFNYIDSLQGLLVVAVWILLLGFGLTRLWNLGLKTYKGDGR